MRTCPVLRQTASSTPPPPPPPPDHLDAGVAGADATDDVLVVPPATIPAQLVRLYNLLVDGAADLVGATWTVEQRVDAHQAAQARLATARAAHDEVVGACKAERAAAKRKRDVAVAAADATFAQETSHLEKRLRVSHVRADAVVREAQACAEQVAEATAAKEAVKTRLAETRASISALLPGKPQ